jgi:hypothetical protein
VQAPSGAPDWLEAFTAAERPDLWAQARDDGLFNGLWPVYNQHGNHTGRYFGALVPQHADLQVLLTDRRSGGIVARGRTIPFRWDGALDTLPAGIDAVGLSWKDRYPLIPIERYASWRREDGLPFDPWLRVHARLGARILRSEPRSLEITAATADWESWTQMAFPDDGEYIFPEGLAPLSVRGQTGSYWEPNVWMQHDV